MKSILNYTCTAYSNKKELSINKEESKNAFNNNREIILKKSKYTSSISLRSSNIGGYGLNII